MTATEPATDPSPVHQRGVPSQARSPKAEGHSGRRLVDHLVDTGSFVELGSDARHNCTTFGMAGRRPAGDAVVTGIATVDDRPVSVFAQDSSVLGGSLGATHGRKIVRMLDHADRASCPVIGLIDSGGARIQEGVGALDGYAALFRRNVTLSGKVPQLSVVLGTCAGGAVYSPALTDIIIMQRTANMFLTGPTIVRAVTREDVSMADLGGSAVHARQSGLAHLVVDGEESAIAMARRVLGYLPSSCWHDLPHQRAEEPEPMPAIPENQREAYDVRGVIRGVVDSASFLELQPQYARNVVIGFARISGSPVGIVANQPQALAGVLDTRSSEKAARFVRLCDAFGIPLVTLVDTPGFLPGKSQETDGVIRRGAKLLYAFAEATVPRVTVILRKAYGGAYIVMNSKHLGADAVFAWPTAEVGVMGAEGAVDILFRRELADDPSRRSEFLARYHDEAVVPQRAAAELSVDEIITPAATRHAVESVLRSFSGVRATRYRHDNLPQ